MEYEVEKLIEAARFAINRAVQNGADGAYVNGRQNKVYSTRVANSAIHQNFTDFSTHLSITIIKGKKNVGVDVNTLDPTEIAKSVDYGTKVVGLLPDDPDFPGLLTEPQQYKSLKLNDPAIANLSADDVADKIIAGINAGHEYSKKVKTVSGNLNFSDGVSIFLSSEGLENITPETNMTSTINVMAEENGEESRSNSDFGHRIFKLLPIESEAQAVAERSVLGLNSQKIDVKAYPAILDFQAAATPTIFTGFALSARSILDQQSFLIDKIGEQVFSENMTVVNDPHDSQFLSAAALDSEGVATQKYSLIENGVVQSYAHSRLSASRMGVQSNGCGFTFYGRSMSFPFAMKVAAGTQTKEQLIAEMDNGLLITNFHYSNYVDPIRAVLTGMTKDGLFIIKNGEIVGSAKNMRFTDSITNMFADAQFSKEKFQTVPFGLGLEVPAIKINSLNFSSATDH